MKHYTWRPRKEFWGIKSSHVNVHDDPSVSLASITLHVLKHAPSSLSALSSACIKQHVAGGKQPSNLHSQWTFLIGEVQHSSKTQATTDCTVKCSRLNLASWSFFSLHPKLLVRSAPTGTQWPQPGIEPLTSWSAAQSCIYSSVELKNETDRQKSSVSLQLFWGNGFGYHCGKGQQSRSCSWYKSMEHTAAISPSI